jgi:hypothetical protein
VNITVKRLTHPKKLAFLAFAVLAMVLVIAAPSQARGAGGPGFGGGHPGGAVGHHDFDGHHFDRGVHGRFGFDPVVPYYGYDPEYEAPAYWYYCPSYGAYYPSVASCPDAWVPVPAS